MTYKKCKQLARDSIASIINALESYTSESADFCDDSGDYFSAIVDQLQWIGSTMQDADPRDVVKAFATLLNATRDDIQEDVNKGCGFIIGYADHDTPISRLMKANRED